ncbi:MAG: carbohydrate binding domain-containing protein [Mobilitalea sp.]
MKKSLGKILVGCIAIVTSMSIISCSGKDKNTDTEIPEEKDNDIQAEVTATIAPEENTINTYLPEGYSLVWEDNFDGSSLDLDSWNQEKRQPGWVNSELQEYTDSTLNTYVKDGKLTIQAIKDGDYYTSGKVTTQNKHDYTYGLFEIRAKVPEGQGLWPALWMMPTDESFYGQWPKCGEIDIMEILGHETNKLYATIHYGEPHGEKQGSYILPEGKFSDDYHVYTCEWLPGELRFYIDGILYHTANNWFTKADEGEITFPAPFDQPFFLQFNLAVGGVWPGNPDETTNFENAKFEIDYVKVYQQDSYNEDVTKPGVATREVGSDGNYIINGDFSEAESLDDTDNWIFLTANGGAADTAIADNKITITSTNAGTVDYGVQFVQGNIPMQKGAEYELSFTAKATENRTMIVTVSAPDNNWIRYFADTKLELTPEEKRYTYTFTMTEADDPNGRLEFNLGNQNSIAGVEISDVKLIMTGQKEIDESSTAKSILNDGNHVYNGKFQEGDGRLAYWTVNNNAADASVSVTNANLVRELMAEVPDSISSMEDVTVTQSNLAITENKEYVLSFQARNTKASTIVITVGGNDYEVPLTAEATTYKLPVVTDNALSNKDLVFKLGVAGTTYLDNVRLTEDALVINGDFSNDWLGFTVFADNSIASKVSSSADNDEAELTIGSVGSFDWHIQLMQKNIRLEKDKWYRISFDAKSDLDRKIMFALQRDGAADDVWTLYSGASIIDIKSEYKNYELVFQMTSDTDEHTIFSISMGNLEGKELESHKVWIDNVVLEEVEEP